MPLCVCVFNTSLVTQTAWKAEKSGHAPPAAEQNSTNSIQQMFKLKCQVLYARLGSYTMSMNVMLPINQIQGSKEK